jgi:hypothetical protein
MRPFWLCRRMAYPSSKSCDRSARGGKMSRQVIRGERYDFFRTRQSSLDQHLPWLDDQWAVECRNGPGRHLRARGLRCSPRVIGQWATRRGRAEKAGSQNLRRIPSAKRIARLMAIGREVLAKAETVTIAAIEVGVPTLVEAREIIAEVHLMTSAGSKPVSHRGSRAPVSLHRSPVAKDEPAARAAITLPWSNGQTKGQITRLKRVRLKCTAARYSICFKPD